MSLSIDGFCVDCIFDIPNSIVRFVIQDNDGKYTTCDYIFEGSFPLKKGDTLSIEGNFTQKINSGEWISIFDCTKLTAIYHFDLLSFLMQYMPYMKVDEKNDLENVTKFYREVCDKIVKYCTLMMGKYTIDNICKLFSGLYRSIEIGDDDSLFNFAKSCFNNGNLKKIKFFLTLWNKNVLIRPLELLGLTIKEIESIHIPLYEAYNIIKRNPYRLPQIPLEKATKIVTHHLRLEPENDNPINHEELKTESTEAIICGTISRIIYDNIEKKKWSSTPISKIKEKMPVFDMFKEKLQKYYFCIEEEGFVYFEVPYGIEVTLAKKMSKLIERKPITIKSTPYLGIIPSDQQQKAIEGSVTEWASMVFGGPGTGKTDMVLSNIIKTINNNGFRSICIAFTGAATSKIRETTTNNGVYDLTDIYTINMAITLVQKIIDMQIKYIIIDEISMVNSGLMAELISVFKKIDYHFIFIGDSNQLEPINWGNFMVEMLKTPIKKFKLIENFRSEKSIVKLLDDIINPERILKHQNVDWNVVSSDFRITIGDLAMLEQWISHYAYQFQMDSTLSKEENLIKFSEYRDKFTIICPYVKVCEQINPIFQKYFMQPVESQFTDISFQRYYLGDRVMKLINDYGINVMNGEQGKIIKVNPNYIVCQFRGKSETITPYVEREKFSAMKYFVKKNEIDWKPYKIMKDGTKKEKTKEEMKPEIDNLKQIYLPPLAPNQIEQPDRKIIELYFELLEEYPYAIYNIKEEAEFLSIKSIALAYALTTHKSQGSQYVYTIFFINGKINYFVTVNNVYTGVSRAKKFLHIITETIELLNSACLTKQRYVYDRLHWRINYLLPKELTSAIEIKEEDFTSQNDEIDEVDENFDDIGY